ncbi:inositol monophosphatase family protein [Chelativorans intermedius]|uniref:Inositol monophosphatase family protein n=1 Tax=Chelativorans intermedius TaxID=515947 RepID=A0ABV6D9A5_9HYPH|nr:inositol monophosphatase [Chelativorans intermedius]MCT9000007.1 inositol monophosphatase [Chelativorans intermedius]
MNSICDADLEAVMADMRLAALQEVMPRFQRLESGEVRSKAGAEDLVTEADLGAERMLTAALARRFPGALVIGEEAVSAEPQRLRQLGRAALSIVIDPVDGTWNFAHGLPLFGMMVALVAEERTVAGIIHYPLTGEFVFARAGGGAWLAAPDGQRRPLRVAPPRPVGGMSGIVGLPQLPAEEQAALAPRLPAFQRVTNYRCSAYEYRLLAQGSADFLLNAQLMPWDHLAGHLIHREAGGHAAVLPGTPYRPSMTEGRLLLASDAASWQAICRALGLS